MRKIAGVIKDLEETGSYNNKRQIVNNVRRKKVR